MAFLSHCVVSACVLPIRRKSWTSSNGSRGSCRSRSGLTAMLCAVFRFSCRVRHRIRRRTTITASSHFAPLHSERHARCEILTVLRPRDCRLSPSTATPEHSVSVLEYHRQAASLLWCSCRYGTCAAALGVRASDCGDSCSQSVGGGIRFVHGSGCVESSSCVQKGN